MSSPWTGRLPEFADPPVVETVMSAAFRSLAQLDSIRMVEFWIDRLRDGEFALTNAEQRPPFEMPVERFGPRGGETTISLESVFPLRYWFVSDEGEDLVQLQADWVAFNWRKRPGGQYRRFTYGRERFFQLMSELTAYLHERDLGEVSLTQAEVSYVNHIYPVEGIWESHGDLHRVLQVASVQSDPSVQAEEAATRLTWMVADDEGKPYARLHLSVDAAFDRETGVPIFVERLTFRGFPAHDAGGLESFVEVGHEWIVGMFDELATPEMREAWGRRERQS